MTRSAHTRPRRVRAADRLRRPRRPRSADDKLRPRRLLRRAKHSGMALEPETPPPPEDWVLPRIVVRRPPPGCAHAVTRAEVAEVLRFVGEDGCYGLRSVILAGAPGHRDGLLGRLVGPGEIILYAQRPAPWILRGTLPAAEARRLRAAGARLAKRAAGGISVDWTPDALKAFVLLDVLLHEVGHHRLQHESRRPAQRAARTREHEAAAERFARRMRERWYATRGMS